DYYCHSTDDNYNDVL
nr:immunoglobulin light chain junction region [Macaca mulatta]